MKIIIWLTLRGINLEKASDTLNKKNLPEYQTYILKNIL